MQILSKVCVIDLPPSNKIPGVLKKSSHISICWVTVLSWNVLFMKIWCYVQ